MAIALMPHITTHRIAPLVALCVLVISLIASLRLLPASAPAPRATTAAPPTPTLIPQTADVRGFIQRGEYQVALYVIETRAQREGWTAERHALAGDLWDDIGDQTRAIAHWEAATQLLPDVDRYQRLITAYIERGAWDLAHDRLHDLLASAPEDAWGLYHMGALLAPSAPRQASDYLQRSIDHGERYDADARALQDAIGTRYNDPLVAARVGAVLANQQAWSLAERAFRQATARNFPYPSAMAQVAVMRAQQGKDGREWLNAALVYAPDNANVRFFEGVYWRTREDYAASVDALLTAITLAPNNPTVFAELGNTYRTMGNLTEAEYWLQVALTTSGNDPLIQTALDRLYDEEAFLLPQAYLAYAWQERDVDDRPAVLAAQGWALHLLGESAEGLALIDQALRADADNPRALFDKARILHETGRDDQARALLGSLLTRNDSYAQAAQRLLAQIDANAN
jgi:tetratricopeptide (TPR) repeat protein